MPINDRGQRLRMGRIKLRKKQEEVAVECHKALSTYKAWEQNRSQPKTLDDVQNVCRAVGISIDFYITGKECAVELTNEQRRILEVYELLPNRFQDIFMRMVEDVAYEIMRK